MARRKAEPAPKLPGNFHARADDLGLNTISYLNTAVTCEDGVSRWLPRDMIGRDGKSAILYRPAGYGNYSIDGWEPYHDFMFGGRYANVETALAWLQRAHDIKAGKAEDFRGC
ncbi:hypothetical protein DOMOVOI_00410 [Brevundimonas phage vB_BpoS-Domovoi]|uniref:Uncharacterized protein n=1 Tax=Brevundimonas phage vB_BpoS-Domovoi TaxID=2948598 RepID=A0A9E7SK96_9CAUD|nr:hypothetical protein DOMOVOI_00410 [Brevundimonas phage vB_BpoS-Domovoi]